MQIEYQNSAANATGETLIVERVLRRATTHQEAREKGGPCGVSKRNVFGTRLVPRVFGRFGKYLAPGDTFAHVGPYCALVGLATLANSSPSSQAQIVSIKAPGPS